jgi:hypothetical protein
MKDVAVCVWDSHVRLRHICAGHPSKRSRAQLHRADCAAREALVNPVVLAVILSYLARLEADQLWRVGRVWFHEIKRIRDWLPPPIHTHTNCDHYINRYGFFDALSGSVSYINQSNRRPLVLCDMDRFHIEAETNNKQAKLHPKRIHMPRRLPVPRPPQRGRHRKHH